MSINLILKRTKRKNAAAAVPLKFQSIRQDTRKEQMRSSVLFVFITRSVSNLATEGVPNNSTAVGRTDSCC